MLSSVVAQLQTPLLASVSKRRMVNLGRKKGDPTTSSQFIQGPPEKFQEPHIETRGTS